MPIPYDPSIDDDASPEDLEAWYRRSPADIQAAKDADWQSQWQALRTPDDQAYQTDDLSGGPATWLSGEPEGATDSAAGAAPANLTVPDLSAYPDLGGAPAPPIDSSQPNYGLEPWPGDAGYAPPAFAMEAGSEDQAGASEEKAETGEVADASNRSAPPLPEGWARRGGRNIAPTVDILTPEMHALYEAIAAGEGADYDTVRYLVPKGGGHNKAYVGRLPRPPGGEPDYRDIARTYVSYPVSRAGGAQFGPGDWDDIKGHHADLKDYSPINQQKGLWYAASEEYLRAAGRDLSKDIKDPANYPMIVSSLRDKWPSLPGATQGKRPGNTQALFNQRMQGGIQKYTSRDFDPSS